MIMISLKDKLRNYKISLLVGSIALIIEGLIMMWKGDIDFPVFLGLLFGLISMTISFWHYIGASKETRDERMLRVGTYATTLAWFCTIIIIDFAAIIAHYAHIQYNGVQAMGFALSVGIASMMGWLAYYSTKGDLDLLDNA
jgi:drug/metabolite transporter (DMT)-like permease